MKKITAFIFDLSQGGAQGVFVTVMNHFSKMGYPIEVVVQNLDSEIHVKNLEKQIKVVSLNAKSAKEALPKLIKYVKHNDITCAFVFGPELAVNLYLAKVINKKSFPIVGRCINTLSVEMKHTSSLFRKCVTNNLIKLFFNKLNLVIAQSKGMAEDLINNYHFNENKVKVINNALSTKYENELSNTNLVSKSDYILFSGRLENQKGLFMLFDAFSRVKDGISLMLIGEGSLKEELVNYAEKLGISERVKFIGFVSDAQNYYREAKCVVLSSYFEGFPNVLIESIACGTPVVSFDCPSGPNEIIVDGVNGYLVKYCDTDDLSNALTKAIATDWDYCKITETAFRYKSSEILSQYENIINLV